MDGVSASSVVSLPAETEANPEHLKVAISFIVPAHNEEACLGVTLRAIHETARVINQSYEIVVVDDASTDATAEIARQNNARVVSVNHRQIAATRNSGGRAATGARFFFIDADTTINARAVAAALREMDKGAVGGGGPTWLDKNEIVPLYIRLVAFLFIFVVKIIGFAGGAFMFCTREAFKATGGFSERLYWGEEGAFTLALKREGRFAGLTECVLTSGRRFRKTSSLQLFVSGIRLIFSPLKMFTQRSSVEKIWYDSDRSGDDKMPNSLAVRICNGIALLLVIDLATGFFWEFVPWSLTPISTPLGKLRLANAIFLCHIAMILWPIAIILFLNLLWQKFGMEWIRTVALIAFCAWQLNGATRVVIWSWTELFHRTANLFNG